jgi:hypothetical protein
MIQKTFFIEKKMFCLIADQVGLHPKCQPKVVTYTYVLLGCLLNALVEELIIRVTTVEDVPATTAVHLVTVFSIVIDRAPQVFQVTAHYIWRGETVRYDSLHGVVFLEKLIVTQLVEKFVAFYRTPRFIIVFTRACHWSLS